MTSPYTSNLLQHSTSEAATAPGAAPRPQVGPSRSVTHVVAAPAPVYAPQPMYQAAEPQQPRGARTTAMMLSLIVVLVGAVALIGAYFATKDAAPSLDEVTAVQALAFNQAFDGNRQRSIGQGREAAIAASASAGALRAQIARERAYNAAFPGGLKAGNRTSTPRSYGGGYSAPRYNAPNNYDVASAFGQAQNLANTINAPVDLEIY